LSREYLREFSKKFETALLVYSGLGGNRFMKKTRSKKSRDTVLLKNIIYRIQQTNSALQI
jgi:hypothetical protein